jgi:hypothetical protein
MPEELQLVVSDQRSLNEEPPFPSLLTGVSAHFSAGSPFLNQNGNGYEYI